MAEQVPLLGSSDSAWEARHALLSNSAPDKFSSREEALRWVRANGFTPSGFDLVRRIVFYKSDSAKP